MWPVSSSRRSVSWADRWLPVLVAGWIIGSVCAVSGQGIQAVAQGLSAGGGRASSQHYDSQGSFGSIGGVSSANVPAPGGTVARQGYIAQLYEVVGLTVAATGASVNEGAPTQLRAWERLHDETLIAIPAESVAWSLITGPVVSIQSSGQVTTRAVFSDTTTTIQGALRGFTAQAVFNVTNNDPDNFGSYAGDSLPDDWQVQHFGQNNPSAKPGLDADKDGYLNSSEYLAGTLPGDPSSYFRLKMIRPQVQAPALLEWTSLNGRTYEVQSSRNLLDSAWETLATLPGTGQVMQWSSAGGTLGRRRFYRVIVRF